MIAALTHDKAGRPYACLHELRVGSPVQVGGIFTCMPADHTRLVCSDFYGTLYIMCAMGHHYLNAQCDDQPEGCDALIGIYHMKD